MSTITTDLRYPIGKPGHQPFSELLKKEWLNDIKFLPQLLENALLNLDEAQMHTPYREGGWTVHQVAHHIADSHINSFCRFRLGLTEDKPTIRLYEEDLWVRLNDVKTLPVNVSVTLLYALHTRLYAMLAELSDSDWQRTVYHPAQEKEITLWQLLCIYAWHGKHHVAHITSLRERNHW
jgi:uncharacterized damage-inducible protein DinB